MPTTTRALLTEIEAFLAEAGMSPTKFGLAAVNDGHLIKNLRGGASVTLKTADKVRAYMAQELSAAPAANVSREAIPAQRVLLIIGGGTRGPEILPEQPDVGYRAVNALIAHGEPVVIPRDATKVQYEGELVVVIGKKAKHLSEADALSCVLGYTIGNDVSERVWQKSDRTLWRAKNTDTFKPMGPWIETDVDFDTLETCVRVNDVETTRFHTNAMLFGVATYIATITRYVTLYPGDMIWMGTDGTSPDLKPGDMVEVEITGLGVLRNPFVAAGATG